MKNLIAIWPGLSGFDRAARKKLDAMGVRCDQCGDKGIHARDDDGGDLLCYSCMVRYMQADALLAGDMLMENIGT